MSVDRGFLSLSGAEKKIKKHVHLRQNIKKRGPRTYVPDTCGTLCKSPQKPRRPHNTRRKIDRIMTTRRRTIEITVEKNTYPKGKREKQSSSQARKQEKQEIKKGNTQQNAQSFAHCRLARFARGEKQRYGQNKNERTHSATKNTREAKRD